MTRRTLSLRSGEIAYFDEGSGPPIVLLHGAPLTALGFVRVIRELRQHYRVIAPDLPGFGASLASVKFSGTLAGYSQFIEEFCRVLDLRRFFVYLNDSSACMGFPALAALEAEVAGLIVADTVPLPMTGKFWPVKFALKHVISSAPMRWMNRRFNLLPWMVVRVAPFLHPFPATEREALVSQFESNRKRDLVLDIFGQMARDEEFMRHSGRCARESLSQKPVLLLYGQFDPMRLLGGISRFQRVFLNHTVAVIPFDEHFPILASGEKVGRVVHAWIHDRVERRLGN